MDGFRFELDSMVCLNQEVMAFERYEHGLPRIWRVIARRTMEFDSGTERHYCIDAGGERRWIDEADAVSIHDDRIEALLQRQRKD